MNNKTVSVVIPVKNEAKKIKACIEGILNQTIKVLEIIVLDSGSTDGTLDILKKYQEVKIINISPQEFNHGETRNVGVREAKGDYVLLTVGDAVAIDNLWIENLLSSFENENIACVFGQQIVPHEPDKNPVEWFMPISKPGKHISYIGNEDNFNKLSSYEKQQMCFIDDVTAMYRRDLLLKYPYQKVNYSEDVIWAKEILVKGYTIVYNSHAKVFHYHNTDYEFDFKRTFSVHYFRYIHFGLIPSYKRDFLFGLRVIKKLISIKNISLVNKLKWYFYNINQQKAIRKATNEFIEIMKKGDENIKIYYNKNFGMPPVPIK
ncbi:MAG: glycosyltransferase [Bacteroidales bacterium]|nr:glycosyltransferase [Bacteroidales bacterium]MBN2757798.1 glycosyltransferase [Bacteroidales bacterium]